MINLFSFYMFWVVIMVIFLLGYYKIPKKLLKKIPVQLGKEEKQLADKIYLLFKETYAEYNSDWSCVNYGCGFSNINKDQPTLNINKYKINIDDMSIFNKKIIRYLMPKIQKLENKREKQEDKEIANKNIKLMDEIDLKFRK